MKRITMNGSFVFLLTILLMYQPLRSQSFLSAAEFHERLGESPVSTLDDSGSIPVHRKLLPDQMSIMERGLWGENGFLRTVGIASPLTPESRKSELNLRRTMLTIHQVGGFVTLGLMLTTVYYGQQVLNGHYDLLPTHESFVDATILSYAATGLMAVLSPPPLIRRSDFGTTTIHKTLAWVHVAGMILTPILGSMISERGDPSGYNRRAHFHQVAAYITTGVYATSLLVITL